jgi:hypothetical protein
MDTESTIFKIDLDVIRPLNRFKIYKEGVNIGEHLLNSFRSDLSFNDNNYYKQIMGKTIKNYSYNMMQILDKNSNTIGYYGWNDNAFKNETEQIPILGEIAKSINTIPKIADFYVFDSEKAIQSIVKKPKEAVITINGYITKEYNFKIFNREEKQIGSLFFSEHPKLILHDFSPKSQEWIQYFFIIAHMLLFTTMRRHGNI